MEDRNGSIITSKQLIFIIVGTQIGIRLLYLPREITAKSAEDAWIAMLLSVVVPIMALYLYDLLGKRMPEMGFTQISQVLFGKFIGSLLTILFIAYIVIFESLVVRIFSEVTKLYLLPQTPLNVIMFMYVFAIVYVGSKGLRVIARLNELMFYLLLLCFLILLIPVGQGDITNILPVGEAGWDKISKGAFMAAHYYAGFGIIMVLYPLINKKEEILKAGIIAISITTMIYVVIIIICELVFGVTSMQNELFPGLILLKIVQIPVIERLEFIFLIFWLGMGARPSINMGFAASLMLTQLFNLDEKKYLPYILVVIGLGIFIMGILPPNLLTVFKFAGYSIYPFYIIGLVYPLIYNFAAFVRGKKVIKNA